MYAKVNDIPKVYQWVPSMKKGPQVIGDMFRESLDLAFVAHNDTYKRHRALRVARADQRFSGTYQCKVSSFVDEDFQQKEVLVFSKCWLVQRVQMVQMELSVSDPPEKIVISPERVSSKEEEHLNISCAVTGVYPVPIIDLSWSNK